MKCYSLSNYVRHAEDCKQAKEVKKKRSKLKRWNYNSKHCANEKLKYNI